MVKKNHIGYLSFQIKEDDHEKTFYRSSALCCSKSSQRIRKDNY
jgi:hypothetical protein